MEGWRQRRLGCVEKINGPKTESYSLLTRTGLLMEGLGTQIDAIIRLAMVSPSTDGLKQATRSSSGTRYLYTALAALVVFVAIDTYQRDIAITLHFLVAPLL